MASKRDREETEPPNEINPQKSLKREGPHTLSELAEEVIQKVIYTSLLRPDAKGFSVIDTDDRIPFLEELRGLVKKKLDNLGRNVRRKRNSATGCEGKAGRPRKKSEDEKEEGKVGDSFSEQPQAKSKEINVVNLISEPDDINMSEGGSSSTPPLGPRTTPTPGQKLPPLSPQFPEEHANVPSPPSSMVPKFDQPQPNSSGQSITGTNDTEAAMATNLRLEDYVIDVDSLYDWM
jgi:hypothetical protein